MRARSAPAAAAALAAVLAAGLAAGCGTASCPTTAGAADTSQDMTQACTSPAPQSVSISVHLCEACSHTSPSCAPQISGATVFLDTRWEVCADDASCATPACSFATCSLSLPNGQYTVHTLDASGGTRTFNLDMSAGTPTCYAYL